MKVGLSYDLKEEVSSDTIDADDALEEYDSTETVNIIKEALESVGHKVIMLGGGKDFLDRITAIEVDIVFNIAEGRGSYRSREAQVPAILEMLGIPYSGSDPQCLAICLDKPLTKILAKSAGIPTAPWIIVKDEDYLTRDDWRNFRFPAIVKPAYEGSSKGVRSTSLVYNHAKARAEACKLLNSYRQPVMVEEFIDGDEVTAGITGNSPPSILGIMRVIPREKSEHFVYSLEVKRDWERLVDYECPAELGQETLKKITENSLKIFRVLGCRDFTRIDFRVGHDGVPYFLEINPLPGLGTYSDLVIMAKKVGWTHHELITAVLDAALKRYPQFVCV